MSQRIRARAIRRAGELLKQLDGKGNNQHTVGRDGKLTQREAAASVGMSERQVSYSEFPNRCAAANSQNWRNVNSNLDKFVKLVYGVFR